MWRTEKVEASHTTPAVLLAEANICVARPATCAQLLVDVLDHPSATPAEESEAVVIYAVSLHRRDYFMEAQLLYQAELARGHLVKRWRYDANNNLIKLFHDAQNYDLSMDAWLGELTRHADDMPAHSRGFALLYRAEGAALQYGPSDMPRGLARRLARDLDEARADLAERERFQIRARGLQHYFEALAQPDDAAREAALWKLDAVVEQLDDSREELARLVKRGDTSLQAEKEIAAHTELLEAHAVLAALRGQLRALLGHSEVRQYDTNLATEVARESGLTARRLVARIHAFTRTAVAVARTAVVVAAIALAFGLSIGGAEAADTSNRPLTSSADTSNGR